MSIIDGNQLPQHLLRTEGPTRHPETQELGWVTTCDCDSKREWWGDTVAVSRRPAEAHQRSAKRQDRRR